MTDTQIAVLGGGPGGYPAAFAAAAYGMDVTLIDDGVKPGGVCLHRGCIPSKALLHVARLINVDPGGKCFFRWRAAGHRLRPSVYGIPSRCRADTRMGSAFATMGTTLSANPEAVSPMPFILSSSPLALSRHWPTD